MELRLLLWLYVISAVYVLLLFARRRGLVANRFLFFVGLFGGISALGLYEPRYAAPAVWVGTGGFLLLLVLPGLLARLGRRQAGRMRFRRASRYLGAAWLLLPAAVLRSERDLYRALAEGGGAAHPAALEVQRRLAAGRPESDWRRSPATLALVAAVVAVHLAVELAGSSQSFFTLLRAGAVYGPLVTDGEPFRLFTAMFLHIGLLHLVLNAGAILVVGGWIEPTFGPARTLIVFLLAGLLGNLASVVMYAGKGAISAGASGGAMGLVGAAAVLAFTGRRAPRQRQRLSSLVLVVGATLFLGFVEEGIDNGAHGGGLAAGLLLGLLFRWRGRGFTFAIRGAAALLTAATLASFAWMLLASGRWTDTVPVEEPGFRISCPAFLTISEEGHAFLAEMRSVGRITVEILHAPIPHPQALVRRRLASAMEQPDEGAEVIEVKEGAVGPSAEFPGWLTGRVLRRAPGGAERTDIFLRREEEGTRTAIVSFVLPWPDEDLEAHVIPPVLRSFRFR